MSRESGHFLFKSKSKMKTVADYNFSGQRALIRVDFNVPQDKVTGEMKDDTRIRGAIPTINKILNDGGSVVLMSHMGRPKDGPDAQYSLKKVVKRTSELLNREVKFVNDCIGPEEE